MEGPSILLPSLPCLSRVDGKVAKRTWHQSAIERQGLMGMMMSEVLFPRSQQEIWG